MFILPCSLSSFPSFILLPWFLHYYCPTLTLTRTESLWIQMYLGNEIWAGWNYKFSGEVVPVDESVILGTFLLNSLLPCSVLHHNFVVSVPFSRLSLINSLANCTVSNHRYWLDFVTIMSLAARKGRLGCVKFFAKKSIQYIPGIGWGMYQSLFPLNRFCFSFSDWQVLPQFPFLVERLAEGHYKDQLSVSAPQGPFAFFSYSKICPL